MIYILLSNNKNDKHIIEVQTKIIEFLKSNFVGVLDKSKYSIIFCPTHIIESTLKHIDKFNDTVIWHPNVAANNLTLVRQYTNSIIVLRHKTLLLQKISKRNPINENLAVNNDIKLMYIESEYNDITNLDWKLVTEPKITTIEQIINKYNTI